MWLRHGLRIFDKNGRLRIYNSHLMMSTISMHAVCFTFFFFLSVRELNKKISVQNHQDWTTCVPQIKYHAIKQPNSLFLCLWCWHSGISKEEKIDAMLFNNEVRNLGVLIFEWHGDRKDVNIHYIVTFLHI